MLETHKYGRAKWIDLSQPTSEEIESIVRTYNIDARVAHELNSPSLHPRIELYPHFIYMILYFPAFKQSHTVSTRQEIDFIITEDAIITARYDTIDSLHKFSKELEVETIVNKHTGGNETSYIFFKILSALYDSMDNELTFIGEWIRSIEQDIFKGKEKEMVTSLSQVSRDLIDFNRIISNHNEVLQTLSAASSKIFNDDFSFHMRSVMSEYNDLREDIGNNVAQVSELRETNNSLLSTKQNEVMKVLTILAFITFPLSLLAGIFGMNAVNMPIIGDPNDFWIIIGIMMAAMLAMFVYFRYKKWL